MSASPNSQQQEQENFHSEIQQQENQIQQQDENENQQENYFPEDNEQVQFQNSGIDYSDNYQSGVQYSPSRIKNEILDSKNQSPFKNSNKDYGERYNRVIGKLKDSSNLGDLARRYNNINFPKSGSKSINNNNDSQFLQDHINFNSSRKNSPSPVKQNFLNSSLHSKLNQSSSKNKNQFITNNNNINNNNNNNFFMNSNNNNFLNSNNNNNDNKNFMNHSYNHSPLNTDLSRKSFIKNGGFNNPQNIELLRSSNLSIFSRKNLDSGMIPNILQDLKVSQQRLRSPNGFRASSNVFGSQIINSGNQGINLNREKICLRDGQQGLLQNRSPLKFQQKQNKLNVQSSPFGKILQKGVILSPSKNYGNFNKSPRKYQTNLNNYNNNRSPQKHNFGNYGASTGNSGLSNLLSQLKSVQKGSGNNNTGFKKNFTKFLQETHLGSPTNNRSQLQQQDLKRAIMSPLKQSSAKSPQKNQNKFDFNMNNNNSNIGKINNNTQKNYFSQNLLNRKQSQPTQNYPTLLQKNSSYNSSNQLNGTQGLDGLISNLQKKKSNFAAKKNTNTNYNFGKKTDLFAGITSPVNKKTSSFSNNYKKY